VDWCSLPWGGYAPVCRMGKGASGDAWRSRYRERARDIWCCMLHLGHTDLPVIHAGLPVVRAFFFAELLGLPLARRRSPIRSRCPLRPRDFARPLFARFAAARFTRFVFVRSCARYPVCARAFSVACGVWACGGMEPCAAPLRVCFLVSRQTDRSLIGFAGALSRVLLVHAEVYPPVPIKPDRL
jgi:hypothetical protein